MSRLSSHRANAPMRGITKPSLFKGHRSGHILRHTPWREGEPLLVEKPCRSALNEAVRSGNKSAADHISLQKHRSLYSRCSKPALLDLLAGILRGERISFGS